MNMTHPRLDEAEAVDWLKSRCGNYAPSAHCIRITDILLKGTVVVILLDNSADAEDLYDELYEIRKQDFIHICEDGHKGRHPRMLHIFMLDDVITYKL